MLPTQVVTKTINKTHPLISIAFSLLISNESANAIAPLINPEYQTTYNSFIFRL